MSLNVYLHAYTNSSTLGCFTAITTITTANAATGNYNNNRKNKYLFQWYSYSMAINSVCIKTPKQA
uniref:Uncharacterized protein n=1 Tax=Glossina palpalis gambiensis TaxID=67801 RepID=A0A1B0BFN7_9MUSC